MKWVLTILVEEGVIVMAGRGGGKFVVDVGKEGGSCVIMKKGRILSGRVFKK